MNELVTALQAHPLAAVIAAATAAAIVFSLVKKLLKLAIVAVLCLGAGLWFLHSQGKSLPSAKEAERLLHEGQKAMEQASKSATQQVKALEKSATQATHEARQINGALGSDGNK
jgi:uncharacterized protein HemX